MFHADGLDLHTGAVCLVLFSTVLKILDSYTFVVYFLINTLHSGWQCCLFFSTYVMSLPCGSQVI